MSAPASPRLPGGVEAVAVTTLAEGWEAVGLPPGSADRSLAGLEGRMLPFRAPGTAAGALRASGSPADLDRDLDGEDWWFRCRFPAEPAVPAEEISIRFDGLATLADVWLNGEHVLASENMHAPHEIRADGLLATENELVVCCRALGPELLVKRPRPRWRTRLVSSQALRWFRTALTGRIPAFAPGPAPVGPWRPVSLVRRRRIAVEHLAVRAGVEDGDGIVRVETVLRPFAGTQVGSVIARVEGPAGGVDVELALDGTEDRVRARGAVRIEHAPLWWPHTHGDPVVHDVTLVVAGDDDVVALPCGRIGFRTIEATDEPGLALAVNGVPVFCRGGALLPDAVGVDHTAGELRALLLSCRDAGLNMIRLSGVGTYGSDELYDLCDELGLLVWQDFPFANLDYPVEDDAFRAEVAREATSFLGRAGSRPSLVVLCGNSEVEQQVGMLGLEPSLGRGPLFDELLPGLASEHEVDAHYVPSSPSGGELPFRPNAGVAHYFGVGAYRLPLADARRAEVRFAAECLAFANIGDDEALAELSPDEGSVVPVHHPSWKAGVPRDAGAGWDFDDVRDHYLRELYRLDPADLRSTDPGRYLALSRLVSGEVMAATLGEWRRARSTCRGALLWTLNDVLPGAGWGILDSRGRPKPAYWFVQRALAPVAVWMTDEGTNGIAVHVANDTPVPVQARLDVVLLTGEGQISGHGSVELELPAASVLERSVEAILGYFADAGYAYRFGPPPHEMVVATLECEQGPTRQAFHFPLGRPNGDGPAPRLSAVATPGDEGRWRLTVSSDRLAYGLSIRSPGFRPTDDWFVIAPGGSQEVLLTPLGEGVTLTPGEVQVPLARAHARMEVDGTP